MITWIKDADKTCGYNNWVGETPLGRILITWKGWKESWNQGATVDEFPGGFIAYGSPDEVREACEAEFIKRCFLVVQHYEQDDETCPRCGAPDSGTSCGIPDCGWITGV